jgi:integrase
MLTQVAIRALKPREKPYRVADGNALYLLVRPDGSMHWVHRYRVAGKEKSLSYGRFPEVTAAEARARHQEARGQMRDGRDPGVERQAARARAHVASLTTFEAIALDWLEKQRSALAASTFEKAEWTLRELAFPRFGKLPLAEVTPAIVLSAVRKVEERGTIETAHRLKQRISQVYRYAIASGVATTNPASDLRGALAPLVTRSRSAVTEPAQVAQLLRDLDTYKGSPITRAALQLAALTFVRPGELRSAEWADIDVAAGEWRIPAAKMKMKAEHIVPLSRQALAVLADLRPLTGPSDMRPGRYLFPSVRGASAFMSENTVNAALRNLGYAKEVMTGHGFRALASTRLNELGWAPDVIERQLAHVERNRVRAAYNRASYLAERRKMMQAWADYLGALREKTND